MKTTTTKLFFKLGMLLLLISLMATLLLPFLFSATNVDASPIVSNAPYYNNVQGKFITANGVSDTAPSVDADVALFKKGGDVNTDVLGVLLTWIDSVKSNAHNATGYDYLTAADFSDVAKGATKSYGAVYIKPFETSTDSTNGLNAFTAMWWQLVYYSTADGKEALTIYMTDYYKTRTFDTANEVGSTAANSFYDNSGIRNELINLMYKTSLKGAFNGSGDNAFNLDSYILSPEDIPGTWQSSASQTGSTSGSSGQIYYAGNNGSTVIATLETEIKSEFYGASGRYQSSGTSFAINNGMDNAGNISRWAPETNQLQEKNLDKLWLPSNFELLYKGQEEEKVGGNVTTISTVSDINSPDATSTGVRTGLWETNGFDRATKSGGTSSWLRSGISSDTTATMVNTSGNCSNRSVGTDRGVRPALHLDLISLARDFQSGASYTASVESGYSGAMSVSSSAEGGATLGNFDGTFTSASPLEITYDITSGNNYFAADDITIKSAAQTQVINETKVAIATDPGAWNQITLKEDSNKVFCYYKAYYTDNTLQKVKVELYPGDSPGDIAIVGKATAQTELTTSNLSIDNQEYTGSQIQPGVKFSSSTDLLSGTDYTATYGTNIDVGGTNNVVVTGIGKYYTSGTVTVSFTITPKELTVVKDTGSFNKTYDGTTALDSSVTLGLTGVISADSDNVTVSGAYSSANADTGITITFTLDGTKKGNYQISNPTVTGSITQATLTINGLQTEKTYNGDTVVDMSDVTISGDISTDNLSITSISHASKDVTGSAQDVTFVIANFNENNYKYDKTYTITIKKATLTVSGLPTEKTYNGDTVVNKSNVTLNGVADTDTSTVKISSIAHASADVGNGQTITVTIDYGGLEGNYSFTQPTAKINIVQAVYNLNTAPAVTPQNGTTYGKALSNWTISEDVTDYGTWAWVDDSLYPTVGNSGYNATFTLTNGNYKLEDGNGVAADGKSYTGIVTGVTVAEATLNTNDVTIVLNLVNGGVFNNAVHEPTIASVSLKNAIGDFSGTIATTQYNTTPTYVTDTNFKDAGDHTVRVTFTGGNFTGTADVTYTISAFDIKGKTITLDASFDALTYTGGDLTPTRTVTVDGLTVEGAWTSVKNVGDKTTFVTSGNFTDSTGGNGHETLYNVDVPITPKQLTVELDTGGSFNKVYNGNDVLQTTGLKLSGVVSGDIGSVSIESATFDDENVANSIVIRFTLGGDQAGNYTVANGSGNITQATLTVDNLTKTRTYNGSASIDKADVSLVGIFNSDNVEIDTIAYNDKNVGTNKTITVTLKGGKAGNYKVDTISGGEVTVATLTLTGTITKVYDGTKTATATLDTSSIKGDDSGKVSIKTATYAQADVGTSITVSFELEGDEAGNYTLPSKTGSITPATLTVASFDTTKVYDGDNEVKVALTFNETLFSQDGTPDDVTVIGTFNSKNVGANTITLALDGEQKDNYELSTTTINSNVSITTKELTVLEGSGSFNKVYNGNDVLQTTGLSLSGVVDGEGITIASATFAQADVKTGIVITFTLSGNTDGNYTVADGSGDITKADLTLDGSVGATGITFGQALSDSTLSGTVNGVNSTAITGTWSWNAPSIKPTVVDDSENTNYTVTFTPSDATDRNNYNNLVVSTVTIKVTPKQLGTADVTITFAENNVDYKASAYTPAIQSIMFGTTALTADDYNTTIDWGAFDLTTVGPHTGTVTFKGNYSGTATADFIILQVSGTGSVTMADWTYGDTKSAPQPQTSTNTGATVTYLYESTDDKGYNSDTVPTNAGAYKVTATFAETINYGSFTATASFTIEQREVTLTWVDGDLVYSGHNSVKNVYATAGNLASGDIIEVTVANGDNEWAVGNYTATATGLTGTKAANYKLPSEDTHDYEITVFEIDLTGVTISKTYDGGYAVSADNFADILATLPDNTVSISANYAYSIVGSHINLEDFELSGDYSDNYEIKNEPATGAITAKTVTITPAASQSFVFRKAGSESNIVLAYSIEGLIAADANLLDGKKLGWEGQVSGVFDYAPVGTHTITLGEVEGASTNYTFQLSGTATFVVTAISVDKPTVLGGAPFTFDNTEKTVTIQQNDAAYSSTGDFVGTVAGTYTITVTLKEGYVWKNESSNPTGDLTLTWKINKATVTGITVSIEDWDVGDDAKEPQASTHPEGETPEFLYLVGGGWVSAPPTVAGSYQVKAVFAESANYKAFETAAVNFDVIDPGALPFVYYNDIFFGQTLGTLHQRNMGNHALGNVYYISDADYQDEQTTSNEKWSTNEPKSAGVYWVYATLTGGVSTETRPAQFEIKKANGTGSLENPLEGWIFDNGVTQRTAPDYSAIYTVHNGTVVVKFKLEEASVYGDVWGSGNFPTAAGTYDVMVIFESTNDCETYTVFSKLTIAKADPAVSAPEAGTIEASYGVLLRTLTDWSGFSADVAGTWSWETPNAAVGTVGQRTHTAIFTPSEGNNYNVVSVDVEINVKQAEPTYNPVGVLPGTFDQKLSTVKLPSDVNGTWAWKNPNTTLEDLGEKLFTAVFTPKDQTNFKAIEVDITVNVANASVARPTISGETSFVYNTALQAPVVPANAAYTIGGQTSGTDVGTYTITLTLKPGYSWATEGSTTVDLTWEIEAAPYTPGTPSVSDINPYGAKLSAWAITSSDDSSIGVWQWVDGNVTPNVEGQTGFELEFVITNGNYKLADGSGTANLTVDVEQAVYNLATPTSEGTHDYGTELSNWVLSSDENGTWAWQDGTTIPTVGNTVGYTAVFTLTNSNYKLAVGAATVDVTVDVTPLQVTIEWSGFATRTYNGQASAVVATVTNSINGDVVTVDVTDGDIASAGTHTARATGLSGASSANYTLEDVANVAQSYTIDKFEIDLSGIGAISKVYDGTTNVTTSFLTILGGLPDELTLTAAYANADVGTEIVVAFTLDGTAKGNYSLKDAPATGAITAKTVTITPNAGQTFAYNQPITLTYTALGFVGSDTATGELSWADAGATPAVGTYTITSGTLAVGSNYTLSFNGTVTFKVEAAKVAKPTFEGTSAFTYDSSEQTVSVATNAAYSVAAESVLKATNAGTYTVIIALNDGYVWADGSSEDVELSWTISKATLSGVTVSIADRDLNGGTASTPSVDGTPAGYTEEPTYKYLVGEAWQTEQPETVGNYMVRAEFAETDNYKAYTTPAVGFTIIDTTEAEPDVPYVYIRDFEFGGTAEIVVVGSDETITDYEYSDNGEAWSNQQPQSVGKYYVRAVLSTGYNTTPARFEIRRAMGSGSLNDWSLVYGESVNEPDLTGIFTNYNGTPTIEVSVAGENDWNAWVGFTFDAGSYDVRVTYAQTDNFAKYVVTALLTIEKADPVVSGATVNAVYGDTLAGLQNPFAGFVSNGVEGTWSWASATDTVGAFGQRTHKATFTPSGSNYNVVSIDVTVDVAKANPTYTALSTLIGSYNSTLASVELPSDDNGVWSWDVPTATLNSLGDLEFSATFTPNDAVNYNTINVDVTVNVVKALVEKPVLSQTVFVYTGATFTPGIATSVAYTITGNTSASAANGDTEFYTITVTLKTGYIWADGTSDALELKWQIVNKPLITENDFDLSNVPEEIPYNGEAHTFEITLADGTSVEATDFEISYSNNTNAGTATITITGKNDYLGTVTITFEITKSTAGAATVEVEDFEWTGDEVEPNVSITNGSWATTVFEYSLLDGDDWATLTTAPTDAGTYFVRAVLSNGQNFADITTAAVEFTISKKAHDVVVTYTGSDLTYGDGVPTETEFDAAGILGQLTVELATGTTLVAGDNTFNWTFVPTNTNYQTKTGTITVPVAKADGSGATVSIDNWTFGQTAKVPTVDGQQTEYGAPSFEYSSNNGTTWSATVPVNAGNYQVRAKFAATANFNAYTTAAKDFTIAKADRVVPALDARVTKFTISVLLVDGATITLGDGTIVGAVVDGRMVFSGLTAGTEYTIFIEYAEASNFNAKAKAEWGKRTTVADIKPVVPTEDEDPIVSDVTDIPEDIFDDYVLGEELPTPDIIDDGFEFGGWVDENGEVVTKLDDPAQAGNLKPVVELKAPEVEVKTEEEAEGKVVLRAEIKNKSEKVQYSFQWYVWVPDASASSSMLSGGTWQLIDGQEEETFVATATGRYTCRVTASASGLTAKTSAFPDNVDEIIIRPLLDLTWLWILTGGVVGVNTIVLLWKFVFKKKKEEEEIEA